MTVAIYFWAFIQNFILGTTVSLVKRSRANYLLSGIFFLLSLNILLQYYFGFTLLKFQVPEVIFLPDIFDFLLPALILFYLRTILDEPVGWACMRYLLPAVLALVILTGRVFTFEDFTFYDYIRTNTHEAVLLALVLWKGYMLYVVSRLLGRHKERLLNKSRALWWWPRLFQFFLFTILIVAIVQFIFSTALVPNLTDEAQKPYRAAVRLIFIMLSSSIVIGAVFYLLKYPKVLSGKPLLKAAKKEENQETDRSREQLLQAVEEEKIYLENDLNEKMLADHLGLPSYALSRLLNEQIGKSFSVFINEYRVAEAKRILRNDPAKEKTNFAIALESGFRSESVFYVNFKRITGTTPSRYRKQIMATEATG
ncbi:MAG: helix-turn-helix domain-containing protein [Bacteroidota bacterium]